MLSEDYGSFDDDGYLYVTGRKSSTFKLSTGRWVHPEALEQVLKSHQLVEQALVYGEGKKMPKAIAYVEPKTWELFTKDYNSEIAAKHSLLEQLNTNLEQAKLKSALSKIDVSIRQLSFESGELTSNLKLKRNMLIEELKTSDTGDYNVN